jgi:hypothetical protein
MDRMILSQLPEKANKNSLRFRMSEGGHRSIDYLSMNELRLPFAEFRGEVLFRR